MDDHTTNHSTGPELDHLTIRTQGDLQRMWELLMQPLAF